MRSGSLRGCRLFAGLAVPLALYGAAAMAQSTPAAGKQGAIVRFEESKGTSILYLEERGGIGMAAKPSPPAAKTEAAPPKAARVAKTTVARANSRPDAVAARQ